MLRYADGRQVWPNIGADNFYSLEAVERFQIVQKTLESLEVRLVSRRPLADSEEDLVRRRIWKTLEYPFEIDITYHETLERSRSGKFEDFKSELAAPSSQAA
jgi:phenylacetate-CoA ligase